MKKSIQYGSGIRILKQDKFEVLISFIISANNNIPRIKGIIEKICESYGDKKSDYYIDNDCWDFTNFLFVPYINN